MNLLTGLIARIVFAVPFLIFGIFHMINAKAMGGMVPGSFPLSGEIWVYITGVALIGAALAMLTGFKGELAALLLALMLFLFILFVHLPGLSVPAKKGMAMVSILKDAALIGGCLMIAGLFRRGR